MKKLELNQMENVEGGSFFGALACIAASAAVSMALTPGAGIPVGFLCLSLLDPGEAR